jgi:multicomponent Na+:H+ antiporter subunit D
LYPPELRSVNLDADWAYRRFAPGVLSALSPVGHLINSSMRRATIRRVQGLLTFLWRHHGPHGVLARGWPTGSMVLWVAILLAMYLIIYYV